VLFPPLSLHLAELKQECLARGLEAKGNKQDLINRLQAYLEQHGRFLHCILSTLYQDPSNKIEQSPAKSVNLSSSRGAEKKVVKIASEIPQTERMQKRAERFNVPVSLESKKAARAKACFKYDNLKWFLFPISGLATESKTTVNIDKLKERAQRFGLNVSTASKKTEDDEKLKKRKERFGIVTSSAGAATTEDAEVTCQTKADKGHILLL
uniref:SAP domain containing ribonucleoprotein n=1 Tax=Podarcis muralis TaxID=64176 RepID=A0A670HT37_PODMU